MCACVNCRQKPGHGYSECSFAVEYLAKMPPSIHTCQDSSENLDSIIAHIYSKKTCISGYLSVYIVAHGYMYVIIIYIV